MTPDFTIFIGVFVRHKSIRVLDVPLILVGSFINCSTSYISSISFTLFLLGDSVTLLHCARSIHINTDRKQLKQVLAVLHFRFSFEPKFLLKSLSFSLRPSVLRHAMYTIVDRYYMTMKKRLGAIVGVSGP
jgi:hypothetical protein